MRTETKTARPRLEADGARILIVAARYYAAVVDELIAGATAEIVRCGGEVEVLDVPGAFEIPGAISMATTTESFDGFIALGCVIRGETSHYDYVCGESARGLMDLSIHDLLPIGYGILTVETEDQARVRADRAQGDKGGEAAHACLSMLALSRRFAAQSQ
jgi:6,7-dimethyl-8-ribityllumazine synthase